MMAYWFSLVPRFAQLSKITKAVTALGRAAPSIMEKPLMVTHVSTPGVLANTSSIRPANSEVRGLAAASGSCALTRTYP